jgi:hypothetical protein
MADQENEIPCGIYRTTEAIGEAVPTGVLIYYHNHGDPGPGVYLPDSWRNNRAVFRDDGTTIPDASYAETLQPLLAEGFYRVVEPFFCCEDRCQYFEDALLVQLGYNGDAQAILFVPELVEGAMALPAEGTLVDDAQLSQLSPLKVPVASDVPTDVTLQ